MAGGTAKGVGGVLLVLGMALLLLGFVAGMYGFIDEQENQDGLAANQDRSDTNDALMSGGAAAGASGLVFSLVAVVVLAIGGAQARRDAERRLPAPHGPMGPSPPLRSPGAGPPAVVAPGAPSGSAARAVPTTGPTREPRQASPAAARFVAAVLLGTVVLVVALAMDEYAASDGILGGGRGPTGEPFHGEGRTGVVLDVGIESYRYGARPVDFEAPDRTGRVHVVVTWPGGPLEIVLEADTGSGFERIQRDVGGAPATFEVSGDSTGTRFRVHAYPAQAGPHDDRPFYVDATFHG